MTEDLRATYGVDYSNGRDKTVIACRIGAEFKFFHTLPEGADWCALTDGRIVVVGPDIEPYIVHEDGTTEVIKP